MITICISTRNRPELLYRALRSIEACTKEKNTFNDHSWWEGIYKNLGVHVMCGHSESIAVEWVLTDIKLKGISTDF